MKVTCPSEASARSLAGRPKGVMDVDCWLLKVTSEKVSFAAVAGGEGKVTGTSGHKEALARPSALMTSCSSERKDSGSCPPTKVSQRLGDPPRLSQTAQGSQSAPVRNSVEGGASHHATHGPCGKSPEPPQCSPLGKGTTLASVFPALLSSRPSSARQLRKRLLPTVTRPKVVY